MFSHLEFLHFSGHRQWILIDEADVVRYLVVCYLLTTGTDTFSVLVIIAQSKSTELRSIRIFRIVFGAAMQCYTTHL